jgi:hypothetical protein
MPSAHIFRATWRGTAAAAGEIWAYKRHISGTGLVSPQDVAEAIAGHVADLLATTVVSSTPVALVGDAFPQDVVWTALKVAEINPTTNDYKAGVDPFDLELTGNHGLSFGSGLSLQDSLAITTRSGLIGRRNKNRFYLPYMIAGVMNAPDRVHHNLLNAITEGLLANQDDLAAKLDTSYSYCNFSPTDHTDKAIVDYYIGDVMDTQRRRRNALVEARVTTSA